MNIKNRLIEFIRFKNKTQAEFENHIGLSKGYVSKASNNINDSNILKISAKYPELNIPWLKTGEGNMLLTEIPKPRENTIPYYPDVNASAGMDFLTDNGHNYSLPISIPNVDAQAFINVFGDSMYPKYCSGEIIGIKEIDKDMVFPGHAYVIQMIDGEAYIKYIDPGKDEEHWLLRSENEKYKPKQFHLSKIHKVYIIKAVITKSTLL